MATENKTTITLSMFQTVLIIGAMILSVGTFVGVSQSKLNQNEEKINEIKANEITNINKEVTLIKDAQYQAVYNQLLIFNNLKRLMEKQGVKWDNNLPDNFINLIK